MRKGIICTSIGAIMKIIAHGGVGSPREMDKNVQRAIDDGISDNIFETVVGVVSAMEDDPVFNAGTGSRIRLDGTVQMDAAVMYRGEIGAVACIESVKNPIKVAAAIHKTPYVMLSGEGARSYAQSIGSEEHDPRTEKRKKELEEMRSKLHEHEELMAIYRGVDGGDTVGCVASHGGEYAAAVSTGGTSFCIRGRVGDSPLVGCGFYAGEHGAVVTTGKGEELIKKLSAYRCYLLIPELGLKEACQRVVEEHTQGASIGVIAVGEEGIASASNKQMSQGSLEDRSV